MDIERLATSAIVESISLTEVLSPFINDGDKEPSWDGHIYIYTDKKKTKKGVKRVPVQVKGKTRKRIPPKKTPKFPISVIDLDNWLNHGGIVLFVVLMDETGHDRIIYYNSLLPIKIRKMKELSRGKKRINIPLTIFPEDNSQKVSILLNFYNHMQKQTSFATVPLYSIDELEQEGILESVTVSVAAYGNPKSYYDKDTVFLRNEAYMYANIKGVAIPQPVPEILMNVHVIRDVGGEIKVGNRVYYKKYRVIRSAEETDVHIGKCLIFKLFQYQHNPTLSFTLRGTLSDYIQDTEFLIAVLEKREFALNEVKFAFDDTKEVSIDQYRKNLSYYKDVKKMLNMFGVREELECNNLSEQDERDIRNFTNAMVYGKSIGFTDCSDTMLYGRYKISNLDILIWADRDSDKGYKVHNFFSAHRIAVIDNSDKTMEHSYSITHYALLKKNDFLEASNIDYTKIVDDLSVNDISPLVVEQVTLLMLEMLKAYDEQKQKDEQLLETAEKYCEWLINVAKECTDNMELNRLQIIRRKREFEKNEVQFLENMRKYGNDFSVRCGASLLLGRKESAQDFFDEMDKQEKERFLKYPICHFGNITYSSLEE